MSNQRKATEEEINALAVAEEDGDDMVGALNESTPATGTTQSTSAAASLLEMQKVLHDSMSLMKEKIDEKTRIDQAQARFSPPPTAAEGVHQVTAAANSAMISSITDVIRKSANNLDEQNQILALQNHQMNKTFQEDFGRNQKQVNDEIFGRLAAVASAHIVGCNNKHNNSTKCSWSSKCTFKPWQTYRLIR